MDIKAQSEYDRQDNFLIEHLKLLWRFKPFKTISHSHHITTFCSSHDSADAWIEHNDNNNTVRVPLDHEVMQPTIEY